MDWAPILWTCIAFAVWLTLQIAFENWANQRTIKKQSDKFLSGASRSLGISKEKIDHASYGDEIWEKWNRYILDYASRDKWENRLADASGVAFLPFGHLWKVGYAVMAIFTFTYLIGESDSEEWILCMFLGMGIVTFQTILALLCNVVTELITGRLPLEPRVIRKKIEPEWEDHLKINEAREYLDAKGLPY
jgi:Na+-transporting methylmalonyl-CoA/oxaloacetate decarboxylase gamma subunit